MLLTYYKECRIQVEAQKLARGGFGIAKLGIWQRSVDGSDVSVSLWIADAGFETAEAAEAAGVHLAKLAIDDGLVWLRR